MNKIKKIFKNRKCFISECRNMRNLLKCSYCSNIGCKIHSSKCNNCKYILCDECSKKSEDLNNIIKCPLCEKLYCNSCLDNYFIKLYKCTICKNRYCCTKMEMCILNTCMSFFCNNCRYKKTNACSQKCYQDWLVYNNS